MAYRPANPNGQATMANSAPVVIASNQSAFPVSQSGVWNLGTVASVTQFNGQNISMGTGVRDAGTQRVTIATNDVVPASQSGAWNIGTVTTVTTVSTVTTVGTVTNLAQMAGTAISMNTGIRDAGTQRVTIATNDSVPVTGTFWQNTQPVSGTFWQATQPVSGTFWQATQPVSGTVTTTPPANASTNVAQLAGTATDTNSGLKSAGTLRVVLATDQPTLTNKLLVTPDSVALPANQSVNVNQVAGTATDTNSGVKSAGTIRVVLATDQPALTNKLLVTPDSVALPANQSVNVSQMNGVAVTMGNGIAGTGVQRVAIASDNTAFSVIASLTDSLVNASISAIDAVVAAPADDGVGKTGASTAGSVVALAVPGGGSNFMIRVNGGTWTTTLYIEESADSSNGTDGIWFGMHVRQLGVQETTLSKTIASGNRSYEGATSSATWVRVRAVGGTITSGPNIVIRVSTAGTKSTYFTNSLPVGTNVIGALVANQTVTNTPATPTQSFVNSAATTNATSIKGSAGTVMAIVCNNINAAARFVKFYNKATAPTVGTDVPVFTIPIPAGSIVSVACGNAGIRFGTGIALAITAVGTDADTTAVAANEIKVATSYY